MTHSTMSPEWVVRDRAPLGPEWRSAWVMKRLIKRIAKPRAARSERQASPTRRLPQAGALSPRPETVHT